MARERRRRRRRSGRRIAVRATQGEWKWRCRRLYCSSWRLGRRKEERAGLSVMEILERDKVKPLEVVNTCVAYTVT
jgi:hypothetical protein